MEEISPADVAAQARRALAMARADEKIRELVDAAPPLSPAQMDRLAMLLKPVRAVDDPVALAKAAKIVRGAMERGTAEAEKARVRATHPSVIRARKMGIDL